LKSANKQFFYSHKVYVFRSYFLFAVEKSLFGKPAKLIKPCINLPKDSWYFID